MLKPLVYSLKYLPLAATIKISRETAEISLIFQLEISSRATLVLRMVTRDDLMLVPRRIVLSLPATRDLLLNQK